jgi:hypothetical protein
MKIAMALLPLVLLQGCVIFPVGGPASGRCIENEIDNFIGMHESALVATKAVMLVRMLYPDTPLTESYMPARANFHVNADGIVTDAFCG